MVVVTLWPWPRPLTLTQKQCNSDVKTQFLAFGLDLWHTTLTFNHNLARVKVDLHTEYQGHRSNGSGIRSLTDGRYQAHYLPASLSYMVDNLVNFCFRYVCRRKRKWLKLLLRRKRAKDSSFQQRVPLHPGASSSDEYLSVLYIHIMYSLSYIHSVTYTHSHPVLYIYTQCTMHCPVTTTLPFIYRYFIHYTLHQTLLNPGPQHVFSHNASVSHNSYNVQS